MKLFLSVGFLILFLSGLAQQRPFVNNLSKTSATVGETITISGSGFSPGNMKVYFGAGVATITNTTTSSLEVIVPNTATYGPVVVTNLSNGLSGQSSKAFTLSFGGGTFEVAKASDQVDFATNNTQVYDLCACDFDLDGLLDVAVTHQESVNVNFFINTSTVTTTQFSSTQVNNGIQTATTDCGDLDGDGKPDVVFGADQGSRTQHIFIYRNTSTLNNFSVAAPIQFKLPLLNGENRQPRRIIIAEIDGDGKPELLVGSSLDNTLAIYANQSSPGNISFSSSPVFVQVTNSDDAGEFDVADLNGDGLNDIVVASWEDGGQLLYPYKNESSPGTIVMSPADPINVTGNRQYVKLADFNDDGFPEIVTADRSDEISIFPNISQRESELNFNNPVEFNIAGPYGMDIGDINGDSRNDLIIASTAGRIYVLANTSTAGSLSFENPVFKATTEFSARMLQVADFNGDAKPDFGFTYRSNLGESGFFSVIANRNCLNPVITPTDLTFCVGSPFTLNATKTAEAAYDWSVTGGTATLVENNDEVTVTATSSTPLTIQVQITSNDGSCIDTGTQTFTLTGGAPPAAPTITNSNTGTICSGEAITLSGPAATTYLWTLPDGSTASTQELVLDPVTTANAGVYTLRVQSGSGCFGNPGTRTVTVEEPPVVGIVNLGDDAFCATANTTLEVPEYAGFAYQWRLNGADIGGGTASLTATVSGDYTVAVIDNVTGCENVSEPYPLTAVALPTSSFTAVSEICIDTDLEFTATSTGDTGFGLTYTWDFGDGTTGSGSTVSHSYTTTGEFTVQLTSSYTDVTSCSASNSEVITVRDQQAEGIDIIAATTEKCPNDSIQLTLPAGISTYEWVVDGAIVSTDPSFYATTVFGEDAETITANVMTEIGCEVTTSIDISNFADSQIEITSPDATVTEGTITLESAVSSVTLTAVNGSDYQWEPAAFIENSTSETVIVYPRELETTVTVTGIDALHGCETSQSVLIVTPGVIPRKAFSPNGDGQNDCWEILNTESLTGCEVYIFDQRGRYVLTGDSPFENNCVWNGNIDNGSSQAPEGIYYFVMKCDNSVYNTTGTILLAR